MSVKFSELPTAPSINSDAIVAISQDNGGAETSYQALVSDIVGGGTSGIHVTLWNGCWTGGLRPNGDINWTKEGNIVTLRFPNVLRSANASTTANMVSLLPSDIRPAAQIFMPFIVYTTNPVRAYGGIRLDADGNITVFREITGASFSSGFNAGFLNQSLSYSVV